MHSDDEIGGKDEDEGTVEKGPQILRIYFPAMLEDRSNLIKDLGKKSASFVLRKLHVC